MRSKTKIIVLHMKELIYTGIFILLGILFIILLVIMFSSEKKQDTEAASSDAVSYQPGVYTQTLILGSSTVELEVVLDETNINSIRLLNLSEAVTTMYPLIEPAFDELVSQIYENQSLEGITFSDEQRYTSSVLLDAISTTLEKAKKPPVNGQLE